MKRGQSCVHGLPGVPAGYCECCTKPVRAGKIRQTSTELLDRIDAFIALAEMRMPHDPLDGETNAMRVKAKSAVRTLRSMTDRMTVDVNAVVLFSGEA